MLILLTFNTSNLIVGFRFCQTEVSASHLKLFGRLGLFLIEQRDSVLELSRIVPGHLFLLLSFRIYFCLCSGERYKFGRDKPVMASLDHRWPHMILWEPGRSQPGPDMWADMAMVIVGSSHVQLFSWTWHFTRT